MALSNSFPNLAAANTIATAASHASTLAADIAGTKNIDQTNMASTVGLMTSGTVAPSGTTTAGVTLPYGGMGWHDTNAVANGPLETDKFYNAGATTWVAALRGFYGPTAPSLAEVGHIWRDTTLHLFRRYESATTAANGVAGWHPLDVGIQLWKNESGATLNGNMLVIEKTGGTDGVRAFTTTALAKNPQVLGVTLEATSPNAYGVVATVASGATVDVQVLGSTFGAVAKGDVLVSGLVAGKAREAGPLVAGGPVTGPTQQVGVQLGGFAVALAAQASDAVVRCRLLGVVGTGLWVWSSSILIWDDATPPTAFTSVDMSKAASGTNGAQGAVSLADASHAPLVGITGFVRVLGTDTVYSAWNFLMAKDDVTANWEQFDNSGDLASAEYVRTYPISFLPTAEAGTGGLTVGSAASVKYTASAGSPSWTAFRIYRTGYLC